MKNILYSAAICMCVLGVSLGNCDTENPVTVTELKKCVGDDWQTILMSADMAARYALGNMENDIFSEKKNDEDGENTQESANSKPEFVTKYKDSVIELFKHLQELGKCIQTAQSLDSIEREKAAIETLLKPDSDAVKFFQEAGKSAKNLDPSILVGLMDAHTALVQGVEKMKGIEDHIKNRRTNNSKIGAYIRFLKEKYQYLSNQLIFAEEEFNRRADS